MQFAIRDVISNFLAINEISGKRQSENQAKFFLEERKERFYNQTNILTIHI